MNPYAVLEYGHKTLLRTLEAVPDADWEGGVVGRWSLKDVLAHLASFELVLTEVLGSLLEPGTPTPTLREMGAQTDFNDRQVALRRDRTAPEVLAEYEAHHHQALDLARQLPGAAFRQTGILPWYGPDYDLEDYLVYTFYGHKREHAAQIALYRKRVAG